MIKTGIIEREVILMNQITGWLNSYFKLDESKTTVTTVVESSAGIAAGGRTGLITYCMVQLLTGNWRKIKPLTIIVALIFVARYAFMTLG